MKLEYSYLLMSQSDFLKVQSMEEIFRERANHYKLDNRNQDYWIIMNPSIIKDSNYKNFLKNTNFYKQKEEQNSSYVAIISTNKSFIQWLALRIGFFEFVVHNQKFQLKYSYPTEKKLKSNGIIGEIQNNILITKFIFHHFHSIKPEVVIQDTKKLIKKISLSYS